MCKGNDQGFYFTKLTNAWTVGRFRALDRLRNVSHLITTREGFDVDLPMRRAETAATQVAEVLGLMGVTYCSQAHGNTVLVASESGPAGPADGLVTGEVSLGLMGFSADCPILLLADPTGGAVGMGHCSWRGTVGRIASRLVGTLTDSFGTASDDIVACISPSAGPCCYEVGQEVVQAALAGIGPSAERLFEKRDGKTYFDLWAANVEELTCAGVAAEHIHAAGVCTICRNDLFPSCRVEGDAAGRFVAVIARTAAAPIRNKAG